MKRLDSCVSVYPAFRIKEGKAEEIRALLRIIIGRAEDEPATEIFSMAFAGNKLFLRESYTNLEGFKAHLDSVSDIIEDFFQMLELECLHVVAPECDVEAMKSLMNSMNMQADLFVLEGGFAQ